MKATKNIIGYVVEMYYKDAPNELISGSVIKSGYFDVDTASEEEIIEDQNVLFYLNGDDIAVLMDKDGAEDFVVASAEPIYEQEVIEAVNLRTVNTKLYGALEELFNAHVNQTGILEYNEKDWNWIGQTLSLIKIKYFGEFPDGDEEEELATDGCEMLSDEDAYEELTIRFTNTRI